MRIFFFLRFEKRIRRAFNVFARSGKIFFIVNKIEYVNVESLFLQFEPILLSTLEFIVAEEKPNRKVPSVSVTG